MPDRAPKIARFKGDIAVFADDGGENHGFLFGPAVAVSVATKLLAAIADLDRADRLVQSVDALKLSVAHIPGGEGVSHLVLTIDGAPLEVILTPMQTSELAAAFAAASRSLDKPVGPRADR